MSPIHFLYQFLKFSNNKPIMAHKKAGGTTRLGRDSNPQYLGVKVSDGQTVKTGMILVHQYANIFPHSSPSSLNPTHSPLRNIFHHWFLPIYNSTKNIRKLSTQSGLERNTLDSLDGYTDSRDGTLFFCQSISSSDR